MSVDQILTVPEVAADLRCSKAHIYKIIRGLVAGVPPLPMIAIGRRRLVRRSTLERWKRTNETTSSDGMLGASEEADAARRAGEAFDA